MPSILDKYPAPWCIGPFGDIWVAGDVFPDPDDPNNWKSNDAPRHVISVVEKEAEVARLIVDTINKAYA